MLECCCQYSVSGGIQRSFLMLLPPLISISPKVLLHFQTSLVQKYPLCLNGHDSGKKQCCDVTLYNLVSLSPLWESHAHLCAWGAFGFGGERCFCLNAVTHTFSGSFTRQWACDKKGNSKAKDVVNSKAWGSISSASITCCCMMKMVFCNPYIFLSTKKFLIYFCHLTCPLMSGNIAEWSDI